jgi:HAD superfamily hydrolase (TIGR01509 family)
MPALMGTRPAAIIFDMDGLMADTERLYIAANHRLAGLYGKTVTMATIARMMGRATLESLQLFADELGISEPAASLMRVREGYMLELIHQGLEPMPHLAEIIDYTAQRYPLAVATGSSEKLMREVLARLGIAGRFQLLQCSDELKFGKPNPEIYLRTVARLGAEPAACVVLEDSSNGCRAAVAAGCYTIAVPNEHTRMQDLSMAQVQAESLLGALDEIKRLEIVTSAASKR